MNYSFSNFSFKVRNASLLLPYCLNNIQGYEAISCFCFTYSDELLSIDWQAHVTWCSCCCLRGTSEHDIFSYYISLINVLTDLFSLSHLTSIFLSWYFQNLSQLASINYDLIGKNSKESVEAANPSVPWEKEIVAVAVTCCLSLFLSAWVAFPRQKCDGINRNRIYPPPQL